MHYFLHAKLLIVKVLIVDKEYESAIVESGFLLSFVYFSYIINIQVS